MKPEVPNLMHAFIHSLKENFSEIKSYQMSGLRIQTTCLFHFLSQLFQGSLRIFVASVIYMAVHV